MKHLLLTLPLLAVSACASTPDAAPSAEVANEAVVVGVQTLVYECDTGDFILRTGPGEVAIWLEDQYRVLSQVRSASGAKYEEGDMVFWSKGEEAMLDAAGIYYRNCSPNPRRVPWEDARRRGIDLRAVGNEPGWHVEVREGDSILFVGDYGATRHLFQDFSASDDAGGLNYSAVRGEDHLSVEAVAEECMDTMSGERFELRVEVTLNDRHYRGCGMTLDHPWE